MGEIGNVLPVDTRNTAIEEIDPIQVEFVGINGHGSAVNAVRDPDPTGMIRVNTWGSLSLDGAP